MGVSRRESFSPLDFISHSVAQTQRIGARLAELALPGDLFLLEGELGAGKTCLAQGIGRGLGYNVPVRSPTFTLINEYRHGRLPLYHVDLYRLEAPVAEILALGIEDYLNSDGLCLVEWADRARGVYPPDHLRIVLSPISETKRRVILEACGERYCDLLQTFRHQAFGIQ